jgi:5-carboxymethyl-2-hydroxymuconate isomerase
VPHLTLEYTSNLDEWANDLSLLLDLHGILHSEAAIKVENCKSRWRMVEEWAIGDGEADGSFVHLDLRFLEGRPPRVKHAVGLSALERLRSHFAAVPEEMNLQITVEIRDIEKATYFKHPPGTLGPPSLTIV